MKLYKVTLQHTTVLLAESEDEAESVARSHEIDIIREESHRWTVDGEVRTMDDLPPRWGPGIVPWNTETFDGVDVVLRDLDQLGSEEK